jgi:hypothetical protein
MVYLALFGAGLLILDSQLQGLMLLVCSAACALGLRSNLKRTWTETTDR